MPPPRLWPAMAAQTVPTALIGASRSLLRPGAQSHVQFLSPTRQSPFSTTPSRCSWLIPQKKLKWKEPKGRPRMPTGGSIRGTTLIWGDYGLRLRDHDRRISAAQFKNGEDVVRRRLRGTNFRFFSRFTTSTAVYTKGNETRMGTGKGKFDFWAARVPVSRIVFEVSGDSHEQVIRDAMRLAANKLPGLYEFVRKGDPPVMGITKMAEGVTDIDLKRPRKKLLSGETASHGIPGAP